MNKVNLLGIALAVSICNFAIGQNASPETASTVTASETSANAISLDAIRNQANTFVDAFKKGDAATIASLWSEDGEYIDGAENVFSGRAAIEASYEEFFRNNAGAKLQLNIDSLKAISENAAVENNLKSRFNWPSTKRVLFAAIRRTRRPNRIKSSEDPSTKAHRWLRSQLETTLKTSSKRGSTISPKMKPRR